VDMLVANDKLDCVIPAGLELVQPGLDPGISVPIYTNDLIDEHMPSRHDAEKLARTLIALLEEQTGPLDLSPVTGDVQVYGN
jgi:hypothetical protein